MKKIAKFTLLLAAIAIAGTAAFAKKKQKVVKIGAIQLVEHPALDASYKGFVDGLKEAGYEDGKNLKIIYENAQGEQSNCVTIADKLISQRCDMIFAIATPAAQAVANKTETTPILITAVTDPKTAGLVESNEKPGTNVTGTSDLTPCAAQIQLLKRLVPNAKKVAMLYCSSEENSRFQINLAKAECDKQGLSYVDATVSNTNEVQQVVQSLVGKVDAIYTPTDNMIASTMATVSLVTTPAKLPVIVGEDGMCQGGGLATFGINYYELGKQTAKMAVEVINGKKPKNMPIQYLDKCDFSYNKETAEALGITIPADLLK
ncbi:ABC transporter substrate-binding protein [Treponema sp.]|uniref:ABC transporter substrate-binding protein n=1 Tax=Treponema sp. TaxID=166 RepID=UPI00298E27C9|nr:ABC transporter substrate-binding protein [Treponema sp.]MCQ2240265.1 ABC transporter substrate-binding protein [Treponema sp.]